MNLIVAYDIRYPKRLKKVAKVCESYGKRLQKSVFEIVISSEVLKILKYRIERILAPVDSICYLELCNKDYESMEALGVASRKRISPTKYLIV